MGITTIYVTHDQEEALSLSDRIVVMSEGKVEQIGTPFEIYNFPKTRFVASFVGTLNLLTATVLDAAQGQVAVDGQPLRLPPLSAVANGAEITVALRPEAISLNATSDNQLVGHVENISFLGSIVRIYVRLQETVLSLDEFNNLHLILPAIGDEVTLTFPTEAGLVIP
ncbi:MAG: ABC transporter ATP-binding protein [Caldilineaceae bacterium]